MVFRIIGLIYYYLAARICSRVILPMGSSWVQTCLPRSGLDDLSSPVFFSKRHSAHSLISFSIVGFDELGSISVTVRDAGPGVFE